MHELYTILYKVFDINLKTIFLEVEYFAEGSIIAYISNKVYFKLARESRFSPRFEGRR